MGRTRREFVSTGTAAAIVGLASRADAQWQPRDVDGNLWVGWGMGEEGLDGVAIFSPAGKPIGRIDLPERCANLCFGGLHRNRLFLCGATSMYSLYVNTQGAVGG